MKRNHILRTIIATLLCLMMITPSMADVLTLPSGTKAIEEYAFYGDTSIDEVVLPEGIEEIGDYAFAESGLTKINLPSNLSFVSDDAFEGTKQVDFDIPNAGAGYDWAVNHGLRAPHGDASDGAFLLKGSSELLRTNTIIEYDISNGALQLGCNMNTVRALSELKNEGYTRIQYFDYCLNEVPDFADDTQINRHVGGISDKMSFDLNFFIRLVVQAYSNDSIIPIEIPRNRLKQASYCVLHMGFSKDGEAAPSLWGSYAFKAIVPQYSVSGKVVDSKTENGIQRVYVSCHGRSAYTDQYGQFSLELPAGKYTLYYEIEGLIVHQEIVVASNDLLVEDMVIDITNTRKIILDYQIDLLIGDEMLLEPEILPYDVDEIPIIWSSDNESVAVVDDNGYVTALAVGKAVISAKAADGSGAEDSVCIFVKEDVPFDYIDNIDGTVTITKYWEIGEEVIIPADVDGKRITALAEGLFSGNKQLTRLVIQADIKSIPDNLCKQCPYLKEVVLPDAVESIGLCAFDCPSLAMIYLPAEVNQIADNAFQQDTKIQAVEGSMAQSWAEENGHSLSYSPTSWFSFESNGDGTCTLVKFVGPSEVHEDMVIPKTNDKGERVVKIGPKAFYQCGGFWTEDFTVLGQGKLLGRLVIPDGVEEIGDEAFDLCTGLGGSLIIPDSVTYIGRAAFANCWSLKGSLKLSNNLTTIGCEAFANVPCTGDLIIPGSLETISSHAFAGFGNYLSPGRLFISEGVKTIGEAAFSASYFSGEITIPDSVTMIDDWAFHGGGSIGGVPTGPTWDVLTIGNGVTKIGREAFNTRKINCLVIPETVTVIEKEAFSPEHDIIKKICCVPSSAAWTWFSANGFGDRLLEWDIHYVAENEVLYDTWWNSNVAPFYKIYLQKTLSTDTISTDHNYLLRKVAELNEIMKNDFEDNANLLRLRYNTENNIWLLDDDARLRLTLLNLAKQLEEDEEKDTLIVRGDLANLSPVAIANEQTAQMDDKMLRIKDACQFATSGIDLAITNYLIAKDLAAEAPPSLSTEEKIVKKIGETLKDAVLDLPEKAMDAIIEIQADYDAATVLRAYVREYTDAMKSISNTYAKYLENTYFGPNQFMNSSHDDFYSQAVFTFVDAFRSIGDNESELINVAREAILEGTGYTYDDVLSLSAQFSSDWMERLDDEFWSQLIIDTARNVMKNIIKELLPHFQEDMIVDVVDKMIVIDVSDTGSVSFSMDIDAGISKIEELDGQMTLAELLTGAEMLSAGNNAYFNNVVPYMKTAMAGKASDNYIEAGFDMSRKFKDNVKVAGTIIKIAKKAYSFVEGIIFSAYDLIEVQKINNGKELYDSYGCALIDAFGQRINLRANGELLTGLSDEHFATWSAKKKESERKALVSLLNLDEYILIIYDSMRKINMNSSYSFTPNYEWLDDEDISYDLTLIRNVRNMIKTVPENCRIYDN